MNKASEPKAKEHSKSCLEDSTEQSESNPGRSLGITASSKKGCLEDSTEQSESNPGRSLGITRKVRKAVWKTVPH